MDLDEAISRHAQWKLKFRAAISQKETMDAAIISRDNCCDLGKWLHGDAKARYSKLDSYTQCVSRHAEFHVEAGKVAQAINDKKYAEAEAMINHGTPYAQTSNATGVAIRALKKDAGL